MAAADPPNSPPAAPQRAIAAHRDYKIFATSRLKTTRWTNQWAQASLIHADRDYHHPTGQFRDSTPKESHQSQSKLAVSRLHNLSICGFRPSAWLPSAALLAAAAASVTKLLTSFATAIWLPLPQ